jgi:hypothetical protein
MSPLQYTDFLWKGKAKIRHKFILPKNFYTNISEFNTKIFITFFLLMWYIKYMDACIFWDAVKSQLKAQGITQWQFARQIHVPFVILVRWMQLNIMPALGVACNIAITLGGSLDLYFAPVSMDEKDAQKAA